MNKLESDVTVVGGGVAGLWCAKELVDEGLSVTLVEQANALATGATTRNEGWLHNGAYHSIGIDDETDAASVTERTRYGHERILAFAPESVEQPSSFAFIKEEGLVEQAVSRWTRFGVAHREVSPHLFADEGFNTSRISAAYETADRSVNSRVICNKLANYVIGKGANTLLGASFVPTGLGEADVLVEGKTYSLRSDKFLITAGTGTKAVFEQILGRSFPMRFFKSHLLVTPRLTNGNYFYVDTWEAGMMAHGAASIIGFNKDSVEIPEPDYEVIPEKAQLIYDRLVEMLPRVARYALDGRMVQGVACVKPDAADYARILDTNARQDLNVKVYEPEPGYICAIPGKMTEAPALARAVMEYLLGSGYAPTAGKLNASQLTLPSPIPVINLRPADEWMQQSHPLAG